MTTPRRLIVLALVVTAGAELAMRRVPWCACGSIKLWHGVVMSAENSQHLTDWYSFTHVTHGVLFYALLSIVASGRSQSVRLAAAVWLEAAWEILENSPVVIDRYRTATIALDYYGDSVVNSLADIGAMALGFWLARRLPVYVSALVVVAMEVALAIVIRDNLILNVLMLLYPVDGVRRWQSGL